MVHRETTGVLAKIASKLRACAHAFDVDRETLRARWEVDNNFQLQHITDHIAISMNILTRAEDGIEDALAVIEDRLL